MFKEKQTWSYKNRVGEDKSTLLILHIDNYKEYGKIVHISINNITIRNLAYNKEIANEIQHVPISEDALAKSVLEIINQESKIPDFSKNYRYWKQAFENNEGGVWCIEVDKIVEYTEETMNISSD